jgi:hypothetical protein
LGKGLVLHLLNAAWQDEALRVLIFVCVPLVILLAVAITLLSRGRKKKAAFPRFSVSISSVGRQEAYVIYRRADRELEFAAEIGRGKRFFTPRISVQIPRELPHEDVREILPNLAMALGRLHYEYVLFRKGERQTIPAEEREAAIAELRRMGCEVKEPIGPAGVQRATIDDWQSLSGKPDQMKLDEVRRLMRVAAGVRENIEILMSSEAVGKGRTE